MAEEESNYDKIMSYFQSNTSYSSKEIIDGLIKLGIAPKGNGLLSRLGQKTSFRVARGKQIGEKVRMIKFIKVSKHSNQYTLKYWVNEF